MLRFSRFAFLTLLTVACAIPSTAQAIAPMILTQQDSAGKTVALVLHSFSYLVTAQNPAQPGEVLTLFATGLGPTNPAVASGVAAPFSPPAVTTTIPTVTAGGQSATVIASELAPGAVGIYQVTFELPAGGCLSGNQPLVLRIGSAASSAVTLPLAISSGPAISAVVNGSFSSTDPIAAPGTILSVFACGLGTPDALSAFPATSFQGLSVTFNGTPGPLFAVVASQSQINVQAPTELPDSGVVAVQVKNSAGASASFTLHMTPASPGIFRLTDPSQPSRKNAAALFANTAWLAIPASTASAFGIPGNCSAGGVSASSLCGQPARAGDILQVFMTGLGKATPGGDPNGAVLPTGSVASASGNPLYVTVLAPAVTIGGAPAQVLFSGIAPGFAGLYQVNVQVPGGVVAGDDVPLVITMPNASSDNATIAVSQ